MSKKKVDWIIVNKIIISLEIMLFFVCGLVVAAYYYAKDYTDFISNAADTANFWIGFAILSAMIFCSGGIVASLLIAISNIDQAKRQSNHINKERKV